MAKQLIAKGQVTISTQQEAYTIVQSLSDYIFPAENSGVISSAVTVISTVKVTQGNTDFTGFSIGTITKPAGFSAITVNNTNKTITYSIAANTANLSDSGTITIPIIIGTVIYSLSFSWSKAKKGNTGDSGVDANLLDWVADWNTNKTVIGADSVITPKIFTGIKNANGTITGIAIGKFPLRILNASGSIVAETINGIYGFKDGNKTFYIDSSGNTQLGYGTHFIKYNVTTGKIEFGADVSLNWTTAANNALTSAKSYADTKKTEAISTASADATNKANAVKEIAQLANDRAGQKVRYIRDWLNGSTANTGNHWIQIMAFDQSGTNIALSKNVSGASSDKRVTNGNTDTTPYVSVEAGLKHLIVDLGAVYDIKYLHIWHYYPDKRTYYETKTECSVDGVTWFVIFDSSTEGTYKETADGVIHFVSEYDRATLKTLKAQETADAITKTANDEKWGTKLTYIDSTGIFTGILSANTVNAVKINASQITAGIIDAARINVDALKASLITASNINALTLTVNKGTVGGWIIDGDSIVRGTKNNTAAAYTAASGSVTIGSNGIRGFKWRLDTTGAGAVAGGNISWDAGGNVTFGSSVALNWNNAADNALSLAKTYADTTKTEAISTASTDATTKANQAKTDAIASAATDATNKIDALQIGGTNLLNNSGDWRTEGWNSGFGSNGGGYTIDSSVLYNGKVTLKTLVGTGLQHSWLKLENGVEYTYSAIVKCNETITGTGTSPLHYQAGLNNASQGKLIVIKYDTSVVANVWRKISVTFKLTDDADSYRPFFYRGSNGTTTYWLANIKLEKGNKATDWTPSVSDTTANIAEAKSAGTTAQAIADAITKKANDEKWATKLTYIDSTGIFTGTLSANIVNAIKINASQITAGTIDTARLNVDALKSTLITAANIDALTLNVIKGKIGGWTISADAITTGSIGTVGAVPIQLRSSTTGSGNIFSGGLKLYGLSMVWYQSNNAGHIVFGQVAANGSTVKTGFVGLQMLAWDGTEYFCLSANSTLSGSKEVYNRIAGWAFDNDSIFRETKNNTTGGLTAASGSITIGSNGIRGFKWRFDSTGSGAIAGGNISWDAGGNVTFASSVSLNWTNAVSTAKTEIQNVINTALGGPSYTKLTKIDSTGIYTGTIAASQITAGTISADRIAAGSLNASKLDAASIKSSIINTDYINGLACTFVQGKIGGWTIGTDTITIGSIGATGAMPIQLRSVSSGSGYVYSGQYKPYGITMTWHQSNNAGHFVFGQVMATGNSVKTGFIGIQMLAWDNTEYFCLSANSALSGAKEVYNRIAGWAFDNDSLYRGTKNNTAATFTAASGSVTIGSNGLRGFKWRLDSTGAGAVAGGNISWDTSGNVTFGSSVSLNWTNAANNALASAKSYADTKKTEVINAAATDATAKSEVAKELALAMAFGKMLYRDPVFYNGNNGINIYNNSDNGTVTIARASDSTAPNDSKQVLVIKNTGTASPGCGGFYWGTTTSYRKIFITRIIAKIPTGRNIGYYSNSIGTGGTQKWLTPVAGTGEWCEYICKVSCGTAGFSSTHFFAITGAVGTAEAAIEWRLAYATVFDNTSTEKYTTTIDANGIYTGTIQANQVLVDSALVVGGSTYNGSVSVRDASNNVKVTLDRNGINAIGGTIGGWTIASNQLSKNSVVLSSDGTILNDTKWKLGNDGSGFVANGNVSWTAAGAVSITGTINATSGVIGGFSISGNRLLNTASNSSIEFLTLTGSSSLSINASTYTLLSMRADSARTALSIQTYASGAIGIYIIANAGSTHAIESYGPHRFGQRSGEKWNAPGVLFSALVKRTSTLYQQWGNGLTVTSFQRTGTGYFVCKHNLGHTQYIVVATPYWDHSSNGHSNSYVRVEYINTNDFVLRVVNADNGNQVDTNFTFAVIGRNKW